MWIRKSRNKFRGTRNAWDKERLYNNEYFRIVEEELAETRQQRDSSGLGRCFVVFTDVGCFFEHDMAVPKTNNPRKSLMRTDSETCQQDILTSELQYVYCNMDVCFLTWNSGWGIELDKDRPRTESPWLVDGQLFLVGNFALLAYSKFISFLNQLINILNRQNLKLYTS